MNLVSNASYLLPPLLAAAVSFSLAAVVWRSTRRSISGQLFCGFLMSIAVWSLLIFGMRSSMDIERALLWDRLLPPVAYFAYVLFYHFTAVYTGVRGQRGTLIIAYTLMAIFVALSPTDLLIQRMRVEDYGYAPVAGPVFLPISLAGLFIVGGAAYNLVKRYRASHSDEEQNRLLYLLAAMLFPVSGAFLDSFTNLPPTSIWGNLLFCIICTIAIVKYHLLDIRIIVRKSLVYVLISVLVAIPYVGILVLLNHILRTTLEPWWVHAIIILLLAILLRPLYSWTQRLVDRLFYRDRYDYLKALEQFGQKAQSVINLEELSSTLTQLVSGALRTSSACLLLPSESDSGFIVVSSTGLSSPPSGAVLRNGSPLVKWLELQQRILSSEEFDIVPQLQSLSLREKDDLKQMEAELYVPIRTAVGQLSGILILGQKLSQQPYSNEDRQLLTALGSQMAIALENARLYNKSQREIMERKRAEEQLRQSHEQLRNHSAHIESARETERTSIAREIHDELGQALTALKMDISWLNKRLPREQEALIKKTEEMSSLIGTTIKTVKRISTELRPGVLDDLGLIAAIEWQVQEFQERTRIKCKLTADGEDINLDRDLATAVFRILQEALTNVARHANATRVKVSLNESDGQLVLEVRDNGKGITEKQITHPKSFGLIGMRERARSWNGSVKIQGIPGEGTIVTVSIPLSQKEERDDKNTSR